MAADEKTQLVNRARSIQGHMGAVTRMLEEDAYCIDIIKQTQAIEKALEKLNALILERHLNECVTTAIRSNKPAERERVIGELMDVFQMANKKYDDRRQTAVNRPQSVVRCQSLHGYATNYFTD